MIPQAVIDWAVRIVAGLLVFLAAFFACKSVLNAYEERDLFKQQLAQEKANETEYQNRVREANTLAEKRATSAERIRTVTKEIVHEVPVRIAADACPLPVDWRVLVDAAARGEVPPTARGADAPGPAAGDPSR